MSVIATVTLVAGNLGLIFLLMTVPLGLRTATVSRVIEADRKRLWQALWPFGGDAGWSGEILSAEPLDSEGTALIKLSWEGRDGRPIERKARFGGVVEGSRFSMRVMEDTALDPSFWANYCETIELVPEGSATRVTLTRTDRYRGVAFLIFRYFAMRRELAKLQVWARTGKYRKGGWFEHPVSQIGFAVLSAFILWPFFGLNPGGLALAAILTSVVALHELGHMAAFRLTGHSRARMIFIPLLGGIAIGGRPYDSRFEVAFVALMGAGFSAFLVPLLIAASGLAGSEGHRLAALLLAALAGCAALFNIANLVPVWKFDGGQVLRQICPGPIALALASFLLLSALLALGWRAGFPSSFLLVAGAVFSILSLLTVGSSVKPRHELKPIRAFDRLAMAGALLAVFAIHGYGVLWASAQLM
ncbi:site-2 protease family protein [Mesorhizobium tamadayense]|uniref:Site-2 protease family protein n=1 Tax=Mesorhizobium tamadayense TaxID=425306 RepID=A0A3P3G7P0_9HYPH|nr:site-2 protease family protein [Mesorhizobium tamadayense]RRI06838.1 site-2 protease family protein [Mesorhizobium tamadayense]